MLGVWVLGGLITLCGALSIAGLAGMLPETGGFYAYLREGWGRPIAFLFGWSELVLIRANALGGMSIVFGEYGLRTFGIDPAAHPLAARTLAAAAIASAAAANICGANIGAAIVGWPTAAKFSALALLAGCAFTLGGAHGASLGHFQSSAGSAVSAGSIGLALVSVLWAYDGLGDVSFAGGEVKDPQRTCRAPLSSARWRSSGSTCSPISPISTCCRSKPSAARRSSPPTSCRRSSAGRAWCWCRCS